MPIGLVGRKCGMTRIFTDEGVSVPVTVIAVENNRVTQIKTKEKEGYRAIQVAHDRKRSSKVTKPMATHFAKAGVEAGLGVREFVISDEDGETGGEIALGHEFKVDIFQVGQKVDVVGVSKGKGFAGTIKRHNFRSQDATHGNSLSHRKPGSVGMNQSPGRVFKGKKMAGQMGNVRRTVQNQEVARIDVERNLILIKGVVPGAPGGNVVVLPSAKRRKGKK